MPVFAANSETEIRACWPVMRQLRPNLDEAGFLAAVGIQSVEGYRLAFVRSANGVVGVVAGYRVTHNLIWGRFCYVDDLVTDEAARSQGLGAELLDWLCEFARSQSCTRLELDSGVQRHDAHRFYLRQRMFISCHHFSLPLPAPRKE